MNQVQFCFWSSLESDQVQFYVEQRLFLRDIVKFYQVEVSFSLSSIDRKRINISCKQLLIFGTDDSLYVTQY